MELFDTFLKNQLLKFGVVFFSRLAPPWCQVLFVSTVRNFYELAGGSSIAQSGKIRGMEMEMEEGWCWTFVSEVETFVNVIIRNGSWVSQKITMASEAV